MCVKTKSSGKPDDVVRVNKKPEACLVFNPFFLAGRDVKIRQCQASGFEKEERKVGPRAGTGFRVLSSGCSSKAVHPRLRFAAR